MAKTRAKRVAKRKPAPRAAKKPAKKPARKASARKPAKKPKRIRGVYVLAYYTPLKGTAERALFDVIEDPQDDPFRSWWQGDPFDTPPRVPIHFEINSYGGQLIPEYTETPLPFMSSRLHAVLLNAGVMNLQVYEADIRDPKSQQVWRDYVAFNVMDKMTLDELAEEKPLLTRLDDGTSASMLIVVNDVVKSAIEAAGIGMTFHADHTSLK